MLLLFARASPSHRWSSWLRSWLHVAVVVVAVAHRRLEGVEKLLTAAAPGGGGPGEDSSSPGLTSPPLARAIAVPTGHDELRVVLTVAVAEEPARWASVGVLCGFLIRLPLLRPLELRRAA